MKKRILALVVGVGFSVAAFSGESTAGGLLAADDSGTPVVSLASGDDPPPKPGEEGFEEGGGENPPEKPGEEGSEESGTDDPPEKPGEDGGAAESIVLTGVLTVDGVTTNLADGTLESVTSNQNVVLAKNSAAVTLSNYTLKKSSGDTSSEDASNFYAVNAVVAAKTNALICIDNSKLESNANGANCLFASGEGSTIYAYKCKIYSTKDSSRGLDATYGGTVIASKMSITTEGAHCAALATDRGNGRISVTDASLSTLGQGSPLIYSTGAIEVNSVTGVAEGAQIAGIEGLSAIRIMNSDLTGSAHMASESVTNGVIIYQSNSGDYTTGTATFEVSDSALRTSISAGALFYITHSEAVITVKNTVLDFDANDNCLIKAAGNDGENGWGTVGSNGAGVIFTAIDQTLAGDISVDGISSNDMYLVNSQYTGKFVNDATYQGSGGSDLFIDADSTWIVTASCTLQNLTVAEGATIVDGSSNVVSIVGTNGTKHVTGTSALTVTVSDYKTGGFVATNITDFAIIRTAFDAIYGTSQSDESVTPGVLSEQYGDAQSATNAATAINENKASRISVPTGVEDDAVETYLSQVEATVTSDNRIVVDLTPVAQSNEQVIVDAAVTSETAVVAFTSTNASQTVTIATTTPGLYYWIQGGTDVGAVTNAGAAELSKDGGSVELSKPTLDAAPGKAFFRIAAGVSAPAD